MEITFQDPVYLVFLLSIPLVIISHYYFLKHTQRKAMKFANFEALKRVTGDRLITKNTMLLIMRVITIAIFVLSVSGPVFWYDGKVSFNDYVIALDASSSMASEDIAPDRLTAAKRAAIDFVNTLNSKTQVGVVTFSGISFINNMLTSNMLSVKNSINRIELLPAGGTDIGSALVNSANVLMQGRRAKTIILITDGSDTAGFSVDKGIDLGLDYARKHHVTIHAIGIGTEEGGLSGLPEELRLAYTYNKDELEKITESTGGKLFEAENSEELRAAFSEITSLGDQGKISVELRFGLLMAGLVLLFVEWGLINTRFRFIP